MMRQTVSFKFVSNSFLQLSNKEELSNSESIEDFTKA